MAYAGFCKQPDQDVQALSEQQQSLGSEALEQNSSLFHTSGTAEHHYSVQ